jgi:hypothetical protein
MTRIEKQIRKKTLIFFVMETNPIAGLKNLPTLLFLLKITEEETIETTVEVEDATGPTKYCYWAVKDRILAGAYPKSAKLVVEILKQGNIPIF